MGWQFFFFCTSPNRGFILTSPFTVPALIKVTNASTYKLNIHSHTSPRCPSRTTKTRCLVVSVGALLPLPFDLAMSTLVTLSHFVPHVQPRLVVWLFRWEHCCPSLSTWRYSSCLCTPPPTGQATVFTRSRSEGRSWSRAPYLPLRRRPLRTIRPPPPTVFTELQWGELRRGASGTCARVAGSFSISEWSVLLPSGQLLVLAVCGRSISKWQHFRYQRNAGQGGSSKSLY